MFSLSSECTSRVVQKIWLGLLIMKFDRISEPFDVRIADGLTRLAAVARKLERQPACPLPDIQAHWTSEEK